MDRAAGLIEKLIPITATNLPVPELTVDQLSPAALIASAVWPKAVPLRGYALATLEPPTPIVRPLEAE